MKPYIFTLICCLGVHIATAQETIKDIVRSFNQYTQNNPVEKIYLHLDKPYYAAGEYMYFRAYLTDIHLDPYSVASRIIYVELSDEKKQTIKRILLYSDKNEFAGQIQLPDSLPSANYHLRAYTNWMRNAGEDYFYHRDIYIGHSTETKLVKEKAFNYQVDFFPEGGHLLYGLNNRVAFKALGNDGFGIDISGVLADETGKEVLQFGSIHNGMGDFEFVPQHNTRYKAIIEHRGISKEYPLLSVGEGTILSATQSEDSIYLTIKSTLNTPEKLSIIGQSRHTVCYAVEGLRKEGDYKIALSKEDFPTGIAQFILLKEGQPISERLLFIDKKDDLQVFITPNKEKYNDREKVVLDILVNDKDGKPVEGSFSLSVTDDKVVEPSIYSYNIKGCLLLDSDIKGFIENPGWYFTDNNIEKEKALDILLCTQGWTRYSWEEVNNPAKTTGYPIEDEFRITGKVTNLIGKAVKEGDIILFSNNNIPGIAKTDKNGRFGFYGFDCPDSTVFVIQSRTKNNRKTLIGFEIDKPDNHALQNIVPLNRKKKDEYTLETSYTEQATRQIRYENNIWTIDLPEVNVTSRKKSEISTRINSFLFEGEKLNRNYAVKDILQTLPNPNPGPGGIYAAIRNALYIVDGFQIDYETWDDTYSQMPVNMFESIEVVRPVDATIYGMRGSAGAYVIQTKRFAGTHVIPDASIQTYQSEGYCIRKEFYIPPYGNPETRNNPIPDLRTTIYWNPAIKTDSNGKASVEYYTADNTQTHSYVLEGTGNRNITYLGKSSLP